MKKIILLFFFALTSCNGGKKDFKIIESKRYTSSYGNLLPSGICRFFYQEYEFSEYIETQEKCECYKVGDTIK